MSLRPVRGRSSTLASRRTMSAYSGSTSMRTRARPPLSSTLPMSPMRMPDTRTVWPWPGVTPWALGSSTHIGTGFSSSSGKRSRWLDRM